MSDIALPMPPVETRRAGPSSDVSNVKTRAQAEMVAQQFERMFISEMLRPMFEGIETDGPFSGGNAEATFLARSGRRTPRRPADLSSGACLRPVADAASTRRSDRSRRPCWRP